MDHKGHEGHQGHQGIAPRLEAFGREIVDAAFKVHSALGPGLLESVYEHCLSHELTKRGLSVERQVALPVIYDGLMLDAGYRLDLLIGGAIVVEVKAAESLSRLYEAQLLTYLKLSGHRLGFLINFNVQTLFHGLKRILR